MYIYLSVFFVIFVLNFSGFFLGYFFKTDKFTDITYSLSFICAIILLLIKNSSFSVFLLLLSASILIWAIRLGSYLLARIKKMGRDKRFDTMRNSIVKFGAFWTLQTGSVFVLMLPIIYIFSCNPIEIGFYQVLGILIFLIGFIIEWIADAQKNKYKTFNPSKLYTEGLYRIVRYPNYLGEILVWIGIWFYGLNLYSGMGWFTIVSPLWIFVLLRYISGIPLVEEKRDVDYKDDKTYLSYKSNTPILFPFRRS